MSSASDSTSITSEIDIDIDSDEDEEAAPFIDIGNHKGEDGGREQNTTQCKDGGGGSIGTCTCIGRHLLDLVAAGEALLVLFVLILLVVLIVLVVFFVWMPASTCSSSATTNGVIGAATRENGSGERQSISQFEFDSYIYQPDSSSNKVPFGPRTLFLLDEERVSLGNNSSIQLQLDTALSITYPQPPSGMFGYEEAFIRYVSTNTSDSTSTDPVDNNTDTEILLSWMEFDSEGASLWHSFEDWNQRVQHDYSAVVLDNIHPTTGEVRLVQPLIRDIQVPTRRLNHEGKKVAALLDVTLHAYQVDGYATSIIFRDPSKTPNHQDDAQACVWMATCPSFHVDCVALLEATLFVAERQDEYNARLAPTLAAQGIGWDSIALVYRRPPTLLALELQLEHANENAIRPVNVNGNYTYITDPTKISVIADFVSRYLVFCRYPTQPCFEAMSNGYDVPIFLPDTQDWGSRSFRLTWIGLPFWKEDTCQTLSCNRAFLGDIDLPFDWTNNTRVIYMDGKATRAIVSTRIPPIQEKYFVDYNYETSFYFEDPSHFGGWMFRCPHEEVICSDLVESSLHWIENVDRFDALTAGYYNTVWPDEY